MKKNPKESDLSKRERQILDAIYRIGQGSAAEIRDAIENPPTYTAVRTHLSNLEAKGFVKYSSDGVRYIYEPAIARDKMAKEVMHGVLETFFENRIDLVVTSLLSRKDLKISKKELDELSQLIAKAKKDGR